MAAVESYATLKENGRPYSYDELKESILADFQSGSLLDDVLQKYESPDSVTSLILREFPLLGKEDDKDILELYRTGGDLDALKTVAIRQIKDLLEKCGVGMAEIDDFIVNKDGMAIFQEFSITNRSAVVESNYDVDFKEIIRLLTANKREIHIVIDVSNRDFEHEI